MAPTVITSEEVNYLIYRYLQESGFQHTAFTFGAEANILKSNVNTSKVLPGALITLLHKAMMLTEMELSIAENGEHVEYDEPVSLLNPAPPRTAIKREPGLRGPAGGGGGSGAPDRGGGNIANDGAGGGKGAASGAGVGASAGRAATPAGPGAAAQEGASRMDVDGDGAEGGSTPVEVDDKDVTHLTGHESEVFICSWSPTAPLLASGSSDATARIWGIPDGPCGPVASAQVQSTVLKHRTGEKDGSDVTTLEWSPDGTLLATGSYDGRARVWTAKGDLVAMLGTPVSAATGAPNAAGANQQTHEGPIFAIKWNRSGTLLLSGSVDKTAIVWDAVAGTVRQQFRLHKAPTLDVDWRDDDSFASCSTDKAIHLCRLGEPQAVRTFLGHTDEVNCVKWDSRGRLLASCSDDNTARIWSTDAEGCLFTLEGHTREIYTIKWSPEANARGSPLLATASLDKTVRLWELNNGTCVQILQKHKQPVYSVAFSPDGESIASGSPDKSLHIWSLKDGTLVKTYKGSGGIYEVCWNKAGTKIAACFSNHSLIVMDMGP